MATFTKDQRNRFYRAIEESKLKSSDCEFSVLASGAIKVKHSVSGSVLNVQCYKSRFPMEFTIGDDPEKSFYERRTLGAAIITVRKWANDVYDWMAIPDLWENPPGPGSIPGELIPDSGNTPFGEGEQKAISVQLKLVAESIKKTYELTAEQSAEIDKKFEEAEKSSQRMGRKDWGTFFGGILLSLILADIITPGMMGHILMMLEHAIGSMFGGPPTGGILSAGQD